MTQFIPLILFTVLTNFGSQILLKKGMTEIKQFDVSLNGFLSSSIDILFNGYIISGIIVMAISMASHLVVLSRVEISFAYPFLGLSFVLVTLYGYFALNEVVTVYRVAGVLLICCGVAVVARSS
jgi:multidrug transporter EmrE-like cation transporter